MLSCAFRGSSTFSGIAKSEGDSVMHMRFSGSPKRTPQTCLSQKMKPRTQCAFVAGLETHCPVLLSNVSIGRQNGLCCHRDACVLKVPQNAATGASALNSPSMP